VFRARLILALADGLSYRAIQRKLAASAPTVAKWRSRFEQAGIAGLQGQHQGSRPRTDTPGRVNQNQSSRIGVLSMYWHFVDAVRVVVFSVVYILGR